jgi:hypothetical protein
VVNEMDFGDPGWTIPSNNAHLTEELPLLTASTLIDRPFQSITG